MADLTITTGSVVLYSGEPLPDQRAGGAIVVGEVVAQAGDGTWSRAQCNSTAVLAGQINLGIALASAPAAGARLSIAGPGCVVTLGAGSAGVVYCPSSNAGKIAPIADMGSTNLVTPFALGIGSGRVKLFRAYDAGSVLA